MCSHENEVISLMHNGLNRIRHTQQRYNKMGVRQVPFPSYCACVGKNRLSAFIHDALTKIIRSTYMFFFEK